jgi:hypothetical protein
MKPKTSNESSLPWLLVGAVLLVLLLVLGWHFHRDPSPAQELADKASRVDLVGRMQLDLASASEAEKSAVLAITDQASQAFADQAREASARAAQEERELSNRLTAAGSQREKELFAEFAKSFGNLQRVDAEVLALAVKNTNLKAYGLLFGPARDTLAQMDAALARVAAKYSDATDAKRVLLMAFGARIGVLRIQAELAPHIAEESDAKMDQMEAEMAKEEMQIRQDLDGLKALATVASDADLATAGSSYLKYGEIKARILLLSRENSNVRSLALSLNQKRQAMVLCLDALNALRQEILAEPIAGVTTYGRLPKPR